MSQNQEVYYFMSLVSWRPGTVFSITDDAAHYIDNKTSLIQHNLYNNWPVIVAW